MAESEKELSLENDTLNKTGTVSGAARGLATLLKRKAIHRSFYSRHAA